MIKNTNNIYILNGRLLPFKYTYSEKTRFEGLDVYVIPGFMSPASIGFRVTKKGPVKTILVSDRFAKLSYEQQLFALYHEVGHDRCGHFGLSDERQTKLEIEADLYACKKLIKRLNICPSIIIHNFVELVLTLGFNINSKEIINRVRAMESYYGI